MSKIWYISLHALFYVLWYVSSSTTAELGKTQILWKLTSLEWVSAYIAFTYFFFALLSAFKSRIVKPKLLTSLYLLTLSVLATSLLVTVIVHFSRQEEYEEFVLDLKVMFVNGMLKGGLLVLALTELRNFSNFDPPGWIILVIFDIYLSGWYCFVQYMCKKATGGYSYQILNGLSNEELVGVALVLTGFNLLVKYLVISVMPKPVVSNKVKKTQ